MIAVCSAYYDCALGAITPITKACAGSEEFNIETKKCEAAATAGCSIPAPTTPKNCPKFDTPKCSCSCTSSTPVVTTTTDVHEPPKTKCTPLGRAVDLTSCRHFLVCDDTGMIETRRRCSATLGFDEEKKTCLADVDCGDRPFV
jgi:Chitin binding Peritrophin-A domain